MVAFLGLICSSALAFAELPSIRLWSVFPPGGQAGTDVEVSITGADLDGVNEIFFSDPQIVGSRTSAQTPSRFRVSIGSDVLAGIYDVRVAGRFGVSNPRRFAVEVHPEIIGSETNTTPSSATLIAVGTTINARALPEAIAYYRVQARAGQRVLVESLTKEIDSRMEPTLRLYASDGRELQRTHRGAVDFTATGNQEFLVAIHDTLFRGGEAFAYRLAVSSRARVDWIFPPSAHAGTETELAVYGRNLGRAGSADSLRVDGQPVEQLVRAIAVPSQATLATGLLGRTRPLAGVVIDSFRTAFHPDPHAAIPVSVDLATASVVPELEPNDSVNQAQLVALPCEVVGQFYPAGDRDWVTFTAEKGERYWIETFSHRLGLPTSPFILVQRLTRVGNEEKSVDVQEIYGSDANIGGVEFNTAHRDVSWRFEPKESGRYRVEIRDLFNTSGQADPRRIYRLSLRRETPDFRMIVVSHAPPELNRDRREGRVTTPFLRQDETVPLRVIVLRRDGFEKAVELSVEGLPSFVSASPAILAPNQTTGLIFLRAAETASAWHGPIQVVGRVQAEGTNCVVRTARSATVIREVADYNLEPIESRLTHDLWVGVSGDETAPLVLSMAEARELTAPVGGKLRIPIRLSARAELTGNLKLKLAGISAVDSLKEVDLSAQTNEFTFELDLTQQKIAPGRHQIYVWAQAQAKYRRLATSEVPAAEARVREAEQVARTAQEKAADLRKSAERNPAAQGRTVTNGLTRGPAEQAGRDAIERAREARKKADELSQAAKIASAPLQYEERRVTAYSGLITIDVTSPGVASLAP